MAAPAGVDGEADTVVVAATRDFVTAEGGDFTAGSSLFAEAPPVAGDLATAVAVAADDAAGRLGPFPKNDEAPPFT